MDDTEFLREMVAFPEDDSIRQRYATWLADRGDARSRLLRLHWNIRRLSFLDWITRRGNLDYYLETMPEIREDIKEFDDNEAWRNSLSCLQPPAELEWVALVDTLCRGFQPFFFWNNTGPRAFEVGDLPFQEQIGSRGSILTFEFAFGGPATWQPGLDRDLAFLTQLPIDVCWGGAANCPVHPFICDVELNAHELTGADVIRMLRVSDFRSKYIPTLDAVDIPYPGYHPGGDNDEIHTDWTEQYLFPQPQEVQWASERLQNSGGYPDDMDEKIVALDTAHHALRNAVRGKQLWYVVLHGRRVDSNKIHCHFWVVVFAVGLSLRGNRLIGVVTHQICHNLCD